MKNFTAAIISIIFICLAMCLVLPTFAGTWRDDFEDKNTREWKIIKPTMRNQKWQINKGEAVGEIFQPGDWNLWITGNPKWKNYSVSCLAKLVNEKNEPAIGLALHWRTNSRYLFYIDYTRGLAIIYREALANIGVSTPFAAKIDTWYKLTATVYEDGKLEFQIDDTVHTILDPDPLPGGQAGLVVMDGRARFDNVEITGDDIPNGGPGRPFAVAPQDKLATTWGNLKMK